MMSVGLHRQPLPQLARLLIGSLVGSYRLNRGILRALMVYARDHRDPEFRRQADALNAESVELVEKLLLPHEDQMTHPEPRAAIRQGLFFVGFVLRETVLAGEGDPRLSLAEERLAEELTRLFLGYLGAAVPAEGIPSPDWSRWMQRPIRE